MGVYFLQYRTTDYFSAFPPLPAAATASSHHAYLLSHRNAQKATNDRSKVNDWIIALETRRKSANLSRPSPDMQGGTCPVLFWLGLDGLQVLFSKQALAKWNEMLPPHIT